jgi:hypothetical protein
LISGGGGSNNKNWLVVVVIVVVVVVIVLVGGVVIIRKIIDFNLKIKSMFFERVKFKIVCVHHICWNHYT